ncbi:MAG TPA: hypothetical protein VK196_17690 [Magnetospirillum sp.]|nr:hypothetical protein [Magnetospirillum sp.]
MHGMDRLDCDPMKLVGASIRLPKAVEDGIDSFRHQAATFFDGYGEDDMLAAA